MKKHRARISRILSLGSMMAICGFPYWSRTVWAQNTCPNWSPKFDLVDDPGLLQGVRANKSSGWINVIQQGVAQGYSVQQQIAAAEQTLQQMQASAARDQVAWSKVTYPPRPIGP